MIWSTNEGSEMSKEKLSTVDFLVNEIFSHVSYITIRREYSQVKGIEPFGIDMDTYKNAECRRNRKRMMLRTEGLRRKFAGRSYRTLRKLRFMDMDGFWEY